MRFARLVAVLVILLAGQLAAQTKGIFLTRDEIAALPISGKAWDAMRAQADSAWAAPKLSDQEEKTNYRCLAAALIYARTGQDSYRVKVIDTLRKVPRTEAGGRVLALGRKVGAYVAAADLVGFRESSWSTWLASTRTETLSGETLIGISEGKVNNWGTSANWSRSLIAAYLNDGSDAAKKESARCIQVFKFYLGDRGAGWIPKVDAFGCLDWQPIPATPYVICPVGAQIQGHSMSGADPEELRRWDGSSDFCAPFKYPFPCENYVWSALEGLTGTAWVLAHNGFPEVWEWQNRAMLRAFEWQHREANCPATGNDTHLPHVINAVYGSSFPAPSPSTPGKLFGYGDWWARSVPVPPPPPSDLQATWEFHFDGANNRWVCHRINDGESGGGSGATTAAALVDWLNRNPGEPN